MTKPTKWPVRPTNTQISLGICAVWSVFAVRMKKHGVLGYPLSAQGRMIRLGRCPGWFESSLGAPVILLVLSCSRSIIEPWHDKTNKMSVRPVKSQISLGICNWFYMTTRQNSRIKNYRSWCILHVQVILGSSHSKLVNHESCGRSKNMANMDLHTIFCRVTVVQLMDGWVRVLHPFNSISVISRQWKGEHERLCAMKRRLGSGRISPPAGFEPVIRSRER